MTNLDNLILAATVNGQEYNRPAVDLPVESIAFLLQYGYKQYLADGAAVAKLDADGNVRDADEIADLKESGVAKRYSNVTRGEFPAGGGARDPFTTEFNRVARESFAAAVKATGKMLPKDKEARKEMLQRFADKNRDKLERIARDNLDRKAELDPFEVD